MAQNKSFKTPVVTVFCNLVHLSHGTTMGQILFAPPAAALINRGPLFRKPRTGSFVYLLHRHILKPQTPSFPRESREVVISAAWKTAIWE